MMNSQVFWYRRPIVILGVIVLIAIGLRGLFLHQPMRNDEGLTYLRFASQSLYEASSNYSAPNNHVLHSLLVHVSTRLLGEAEWAIRLPVWLTGISLVAISYWVFRGFYGQSTALLISGMLAVSAHLIAYSTNARGYMLQANLLVLMLWCGKQAQAQLSEWRWILFALCGALAFYVVPSFLYGYTAIALWLLLEIVLHPHHRVRGVIYWVLAQLLTVLLTRLMYDPLIARNGIEILISNPYVTKQADFFAQFPNAVGEVLATWHEGAPLPVIALLVVGFISSLVWYRHISPPLTRLVGVFTVTTLGLLLIQQVNPFVRVWLYVLPIYLAIAVGGWIGLGHRLNRQRMFTVLAVLAVVWSGVNIILYRAPYTNRETGTFRDAEAVTQFLVPLIQPTDRVLYQLPSDWSIRYYFYRYGLDETLLKGDWVNGQQIYIVVNTEYPQTLAGIANLYAIPAGYTAERLATFPLAEIYRITP